MTIISKTGKQHGYGRDPYKWVSGLTKEEKEAVKAGKVVIITGCRPAHGTHGTTRRVVKYINGRYVPRVP